MKNKERHKYMAMTLSCSSKPLPASHFSSYFEPIRQLGEGAHGMVYLVRPKKEALAQIGLDLPPNVVAKKIRLSALTDEQWAVTLNELEIMKQLNLKHGIKCYGAFQGAADLTIIMGVAPGMDMFDLMSDAAGMHKIYPYYYAIALNLVLAVKELHDMNMAHRDIKPENIFVAIDKTKEPHDPTSVHVTLIDYGFVCSKDKPDSRACKALLGTEYYMIPGLYQNDSFEFLQRSDWWSVGLILRAMFYRIWSDGRKLNSYPKVTFTEGVERLIDSLSVMFKPENSTIEPISEDTMVTILEEALLVGVSLDTGSRGRVSEKRRWAAIAE